MSNPTNTSLDELINKFADYCECDEYHYGKIDGMPGNHDPNDGHMEFDGEMFKAKLEQYILQREAKARVEERKLMIATLNLFLANIEEQLTTKEQDDE